MKYIFLVSVFMLILFSCKKETQNTIPVYERAVLIVNEGNFNWGNASLSMYNLEDGTLTKDVYKDANGTNLGDVAQSAVIIDSLIYVVINNSAKIVVISARTFKLKSLISIIGSSPRYMLPVNDSIAYVSDLYANKLWIINYISGVVIGNISVDGETNQMLKVNDKVFVSERTRFNGVSVAQIRVVNSILHQTEKLIALPTQPNSICLDNSGNVWVLTDTAATQTASLLCVNSSSQAISKKINFGSAETPRMLRYNKSNNTICYLSGNKVFSYSQNSVTLPATPIFSVAASVLYAFDIDERGQYYLPDAIDYTQASKCFVYQSNGTTLHTFTAGINTNEFVFLP